MRVDEESGNDIKNILSHLVMIHGEWSRKEPISFPLWRQKERDYVSERKRTIERAIKTSAGSKAGKGVAPWECDPRLIRAGGRSRGLHSKAWTGRGPGGRRFLRACKNSRHPRTSHGRHPFPQATCRQGNRRHPFPQADGRYENFQLPSQHTAEGLRTEMEHCEIRPIGGQFAYQ